MCTYNITVDESALRKVQPSFSREAFGRWLQRHVDELVADIVAEPRTESPIGHTEEEMKAIVEERLRLMESGKATYIDGEKVSHKLGLWYGTPAGMNRI
jgi:hypothetical protein